MGEFTLTIDMELYIPDFADASVPLQDISDEIAEDARRNIRLQRSPDGKPFTPLSKRTISKKGFSTALIEKGIMLGAIHSYKVRKNLIVVGVIARGKPTRDLLALIHQEIGVPSKQGMITRPFLGISKKREEWANNRMIRWFNEQIRNAKKTSYRVKK